MGYRKALSLSPRNDSVQSPALVKRGMQLKTNNEENNASMIQSYIKAVAVCFLHLFICSEINEKLFL